jgi:hypothetical protein
MPLDLSASHLWTVPYSVGGTPSNYVGSQVIGFSDFPAPPAHQLCCLVFNVVGPVIVPFPPRRVEIPAAAGGTGLSYSIGGAYFRVGQNAGGRRPLSFTRTILSSNQDLLGDSILSRNIRGLVTVQIEVAEALVWNLIFLFFP